MKTILVPTDFSKNADNAIKYAAAIAKKENAKIILLHAFYFVYTSPDVPALFVSETNEIIEQAAEKKLKTICSGIIKSKVECEYLNKQGPAVYTILEVIEKKKPDLVIMGTKGASGIKKMLIGSTTTKIIEKAKSPVISVPEDAKFRGIKKIIYATDYQSSDIEALKKLVEIAKLFHAEIIVIHASDEEFNIYSGETYLDDFKDRVRRKVRYEKISYKLIFGKQLEQVLQKQVTELQPDLLAMSTQYRNVFEKLFWASMTKKMAYHSEVPLMAFHHKQESAVFA